VVHIEYEDLVSATDLARNTAYLRREAASGRRVTILNRNTLTAALVSIDDLRLLQQLDANRAAASPSDPVEEWPADPPPPGRRSSAPDDAPDRASRWGMNDDRTRPLVVPLEVSSPWKCRSLGSVVPLGVSSSGQFVKINISGAASGAPAHMD
jgi:antitoxin (DNA-binding transcriptional repressor) of toxin-antitoxin stability system